MVYTCPLLSSCKIPSPFRKNNNVTVFLFLLHIFMPLANLWFFRLQWKFPNLSTLCFPDFYPLIHPPRSLALGRGRILIPGFIRSPMLAVYSVSHSLSLPLTGVDRDFPFTEDDTQRNFSLLSGDWKFIFQADSLLATSGCRHSKYRQLQTLYFGKFVKINCYRRKFMTVSCSMISGVHFSSFPAPSLNIRDFNTT